MKLLVEPHQLNGSVTMPGSKSLSLRALFAASLAEGDSTITNLLDSADTKYAIKLLKDAGIGINIIDGKIIISGNTFDDKKVVFNAGSSATIWRFMIPILVHKFGRISITGHNDLLSRPLFENLDFLEYQEVEKGIFEITGNIKPGHYKISPKLTSQVVSGLLFLLPILDGSSKIELKGEIASYGYLKMTFDFLKTIGIKMTIKNNIIYIPGNQKYKAFNYNVEGDYSLAANYLVMSLRKDSNITIKGLIDPKKSLQPDAKIVDILELANIKTSYKAGLLQVVDKKNIKPFEYDFTNNIDIIPICSVVALLAEGMSKFNGVLNLRFKESNRLEALFTNIRRVGEVKIFGNSLIIKGPINQYDYQFDAFNDHRIIMASIVSANFLDRPILIKNCNYIEKSHPQFFQNFIDLGGKLNDWLFEFST